MTPNNHNFTTKPSKNHSIEQCIFTKDGTTSINLETLDKLASNLYQARGTLAFILQHLETMGSFNSIEKAIYDTMWGVDDLLRESHNLVIFHTFKPNLTLSDDLTRYLAQASGMVTVFMNHHDDNGRWKISSNLMEGMLNNLDNLLRKSQRTINVMAEIKGGDNE